MEQPQRVISFGECMIELQGEAFGAMRQTFGGDTFNTAVYLARSGRGLQVGYATALGDDTLSTEMMTRWQAEGIDLGCVRRIPGRLPGIYQIAVNASGERQFSYWRDQSAARAYFDTPTGDTPLEQQAGSIDAFYLSGISLAILPPPARTRLLALVKCLRDRGACVAFDNNYRPRLWASAADARTCHRQMVDLASIALVTLDDEMALNGQPDATAQLRDVLSLPCPEVIVKRGAASTLVRVAGTEPIEVPTLQVGRVVDTTAAGDSFAGAYLAKRLGGMPPAAAAAAGNRLAARVVQHRGAVIPVEQMLDLMA